MKIRAKICGLKTTEAIKAAETNGAEFLGFIFYPNSPRYITPLEAGKIAVNATAKKVAVVVDADDELLDEIVKHLKPDYLQLHGSETLARVKQIKQKYNLPIIKAQTPDAIEENEAYDFILVDAPKGDLPGGNGVVFNWANFTPPKQQWFLSGGLNAGNISEALTSTQAKMVDISSGVESAPGVKDLYKIKEFLNRLQSI